MNIDRKKWGNLIVGVYLIVSILGCLGYAVKIYHQPKGDIVYAKNPYGYNAGIYRMDTNGNNIERLTPSALISSPVVLPKYSSDGNMVAFGCRKSEQYHLCLMEKQGLYSATSYSSVLFPFFPMSEGKILSDICSTGVESLTWSSDSQQVAFVCSSLQPEKTKQVCTITLLGDISCWPILLLEDNSVTSSVHIDWSPSRAEFALSFQSKIYLTDLEGHNNVFLTEGENAVWDPNGQRLVFFRLGEMLLIDRDGHNLQRLYTNPNNLFDVKNLDETPILANSSATWDRTGRYIAFVVRAEGGSAIYRLNVRTRAIKRLTPRDDGEFGVPDWSPR